MNTNNHYAVFAINIYHAHRGPSGRPGRDEWCQLLKIVRRYRVLGLSVRQAPVD